MRRTSTTGRAAAPPRLAALGGQPAAQLGHHAVHGRQVLGGPGGQGTRSKSRSGLEGGSDSVRSISARSSSRRTCFSNSRRRSRGTLSGSGSSAAALLALEPQRAPYPLHVHADHARALALAPEGRDGQAGQVAQLAVRPVLAARRAQRVADALAQRVEVHALGLPGLAGGALADVALDRLALDRAEEEAVEHQLEHAAILLGLGERGRQRLAEVLAIGPGHRLEGGERVQQLRGAHRHPLAAQLVGELEQPRREPARARRARHASVEGGVSSPAGSR